ncbi:hypothetical protein BUALT_Bualt16G0026600 [Buddleja alternifolia]|uniref:Uncharacterized protein n=1 Tax=Buddleja alternifolia TaxID=168488 RepID=A0AAV6WER3_9LAMI|nr:hypothetical protein BUALT_Bualt16G0026600 [Buddleja alternifolia]
MTQRVEERADSLPKSMDELAGIEKAPPKGAHIMGWAPARHISFAHIPGEGHNSQEHSKGGLNELMESKGGKKSSSSKSLCFEAPLGYSIEDIRPNGGIKKFKSAAYSNCARKPS